MLARGCVSVGCIMLKKLGTSAFLFDFNFNLMEFIL